jgi:GTP cyclohydrolase I
MADADAAEGVRQLLRGLGVPELSAGPTPERVVSAYRELFAGVGADPQQVFAETYPASGPDLVAMRGIRVRSVCEHHLLPFTGTVTVAYLPSQRIAGLGALPKLVRILAARPQLQERLTAQIADALMSGLDALGSAVVMTARQGCVSDRGVGEPEARVTTTATRGRLRDLTADELSALVRGTTADGSGS